MEFGNSVHAQQAIDLEMARLDFSVSTLQAIENNSLWAGYYDQWCSLSADGWIHLGAGGSRSAWLHEESGIVYKVGVSRANRGEFDNFTVFEKFSDPARPVRIPRCALMPEIENPHGYSVLAAEYVDGIPHEHHNTDQEVEKFCMEISMWDLHPWNILLTPSGQRVVIDYS